MKLEAYLTIDDSPSAHTDGLVDFLSENNVPAILFCRGDRIEEHMGAVVRAIEKGMVIANHSYSHRPFGDLSFEEITEEIEKTEKLIDECYQKAKISRTGKYFRFPYIDRGDGDRLERRFGEIVNNAETVSLSGDEKVRQVQGYLKEQGFSQPFKNVTHPLYQNADVADSADCLFTYSSCDWMLTDRHRGTLDYNTLDDLKRKIDDDSWLCSEGGAQIVLFHDMSEIELVSIDLISYMLDKDFEFIKIA